MNINYKNNHVITISITDPRATVNIINGNPIFNHLIKLIFCPYFKKIPTATIPVLEPINIPLPSRSAPSAKAHHSRLIFK